MRVVSRGSADVAAHARQVCDVVAFGRKEVRLSVGSVQVACPRGWKAVVMALLTVWTTVSRRVHGYIRIITNEAFFWTITARTPAGWGLWLGRQAGRGRWVFSGSQSWTLLMPNPFCSGGAKSRPTAYHIASVHPGWGEPFRNLF